MSRKLNCFYCGFDSHLSRECPTKEKKDWAIRRKKVTLSVLKEDLNRLFTLIEQHQSKPEDYSFISHFYAFEHLEKHFNQECDKKLLTGKSWIVSQQNISEAIDDYRSALEYFKDGDLTSAVQLCRMSREKNARDFRTNTLMGYLQIEKENFKEAKLSFQQAIQYASTRYYRALGTLFLSRFFFCYSNYNEAIRLVKIAVNRYPYIEESDYIMAALYAQNGDTEASLKKMDTVLQSNSCYYAGLCFDREFQLIKPALIDYLKAKTESIKKNSERLAQDTTRIIQEAQKKKAEFYDPVVFKAASTKLSVSRYRGKNNNLFSILESEKLVNYSYHLALKSKDSSVARKVIAHERLHHVKKRTEKASIYVSIGIGCVGGMAGMFFGEAHAWFSGPENVYPVIFYAIVFFLVTFLGVGFTNMVHYALRETSIFRSIVSRLRNEDVISDEDRPLS